MKLGTKAAAIVILAVIFGGIWASSILGIWKTENDKVPSRPTGSESVSQYNVADIKGSYTFKDVSEMFEIPLTDLGNAFSVGDESQFAAFQCKSLEKIYTAANAEGKEVGVNSVRVFAALYKGLPITLDDNTYLPKPAVDILMSAASLSDEQREFLNSHFIEQ